MVDMPFDPYAGNILTQGLGPILDPAEMLRRLTYLPPKPGNVKGLPKLHRLHLLLVLRDFHWPFLEGRRLTETIDLMIRPGYRYRDPARAQTWSLVGGEPTGPKPQRSPASAAVVVGHSGSGKTNAIHRALDCYPSQIIVHESFPRIVGQHPQVVWQSTDVPASGRSADLAENLMRTWDATMARYFPDNPARFASALAKDRRDGQRLLNEWLQVASIHFLGLLHLDEIQNFFRIQSLEKRRKRRNGGDDAPLELTIIEDQCLKWLITLTNTWQMPLLLSGTPDGVGALTRRLSNTERLVTTGYHPFPIFEDSTDPVFFKGFFQQLVQYQYVQKQLPASPELAALVIELTAGVPRLIIALWIAAHRVAFERDSDDLRFEDFNRAANTYLAPVGPAVAALRSKDPKLMARYEDLIPRDDGHWATFWTLVSSL